MKDIVPTTKLRVNYSILKKLYTSIIRRKEGKSTERGNKNRNPRENQLNIETRKTDGKPSILGNMEKKRNDLNGYLSENKGTYKLKYGQKREGGDIN